MITYLGQDRAGVDRTGNTTMQTPDELAKQCYDRGWRWLEVYRDHRLVAEIRERDGTRLWWGETRDRPRK